MIIDVVASKGITITRTDTLQTASYRVLRVDYSNEASVTEHPVEIGGEVSDHIQVLPPSMSVEIFVTASPIGLPEPFAVERARTFLEGALGKLLNIVILGEGVFDSYALSGFTHSFTNSEGRGFVLRFKHVRIASALSIVIPARTPAPAAATGAPTETDAGVQPPTPVPDTSAARAIVDFGAALLGR